VAQVLRTIIEGQCEEINAEMLALEVMPDHIHLFIGAKPTHKPCEIINKLKGNTARQLRLVFPDLRYLGFKQHYGTGFKSLWATGYYCGSAGHVSQDAVKKYILEQDGKDVFEYDIFNCPQNLKGQLKIGDFS